MDAIVGISVDTMSKMGMIVLATYVITGYVKDYWLKVATPIKAVIIGLLLNATAYFSGWITGDWFPILLQYILLCSTPIGIDKVVNIVPIVKNTATTLKFDS